MLDSLGLTCVSLSAHNIATGKVVAIFTRNGYARNTVREKLWAVQVFKYYKYREKLHQLEQQRSTRCSLQCRRILGGWKPLDYVSHLWFYDRGRLGREQVAVLRVGARTKEGKEGGEGAPSPSLWLTPHFLFNMALSRAKTFVRLKKTPALQAIRDDNITIQFSYPTCVCKIGSLNSLQCQFIAHADKQELGFINIQKFCFIVIFDGCLSFEHLVRNSVKDPKNNRRAEKKQARCPIYLYCSFSMSYTWLPIVPSLKNNVCRISFSRELR